MFYSHLNSLPLNSNTDKTEVVVFRTDFLELTNKNDQKDKTSISNLGLHMVK